MTDTAIVLIRDAVLVLLAASVFLIVFWRASNMSASLKWESKTVNPEPAKSDVKRLTTERDHYKAESERLEAEIKRRT